MRSAGMMLQLIFIRKFYSCRQNRPRNGQKEVIKMTEKKKVSVETIVRTIVLAVTLINQVLTMLGKNPLPFAEDELYALLTTTATVAATLWAWWKNNSFTPAAIKADEYLMELKASNKNDTEE